MKNKPGYSAAIAALWVVCHEQFLAFQKMTAEGGVSE